jgi:hypothetical protein
LVNADQLDGALNELLVGGGGGGDWLGQLGVHALGQLGHSGLAHGILQLIGERDQGHAAVALGVLGDQSREGFAQRRVSVVEPLELTGQRTR